MSKKDYAKTPELSAKLAERKTHSVFRSDVVI